MSTDNRRERTKKAIEEAMITLLQEQSFDEISTSNIAKCAGISRSGFYTHYKDKYEMIDLYQQSLFKRLEDIFDNPKFQKEQALLEIFKFLDKESLFAALLTQNGSKELQNFIRNKLQMIISKEAFDKNTPVDKLYSSVYLSHAMFGVYQMWITRGKQEPPQQITDILLSLLPDKF